MMITRFDYRQTIALAYNARWNTLRHDLHRPAHNTEHVWNEIDPIWESISLAILILH